ncbi:MAG: hypothetical protein J1F64_11350 [Oscillospiraceae bacterium]|nr:hypothetical protein [Oscillospiraceae bacterium]
MNILGGLHKFVSSLSSFEGKPVYIDYLSNIKDSYSIERAGEPRVTKRYTDGGKLMEYDFSISSRNIYPDGFEEISGFFEELTAEIKGCSDKNILPDIGADATAVEIKILSDGVRKTNDFNTSRYSVSFTLVYYVN